MDWTILYEQIYRLCTENQPLPMLVAMAALMFSALYFLRWGKLDPFLEPEKWKPLPLTKKIICNHNTRRYRFDFPYETQPLGLLLGRHIALKTTAADGDEVIKPYTPVTHLLTRGHVEFVIKVYPEGRMSQALDKLEVGDKMLFKGPKGRFQLDQNEKRALGMIAGGTGITPMYQVAQALLGDPGEFTSLSLIYANETEEDILLRDELDELSRTYSRFRVFYVLNKPPADWPGGSGFVSKAMIKRHLPAPESDVLITRCGPPAMNKAIRVHLADIGYTTDMMFEF